MAKELTFMPTVNLPTGTRRENLLKQVEIFHPHYPEFPMLRLHASDEGGVDYNVVYYASSIIAGNCWESDEGRTGNKEKPFISTYKDECEPCVDIPSDNILKGSKYYFHVPNVNSGHYPVTPNFSNWIFPHDKKIPEPWKTHEHVAYASDSLDSKAANTHAEPCVISDDGNVDNAHVIPKACRQWYMDNKMNKCITGVKGNKPFDSYHNTFPLRPDIHRYFDYSRLTLIPKRDKNNSYKLAVHVLMPPGKSNNLDLQVIEQYHNRLCLPIRGIPPEYLFARFAWSLFHNIVLVFFMENDGAMLNVGLVQKSKDTNSRESISKMMDKDIPQPRTGSSKTEPQSNNTLGTKRGRGELEEQDDNDDRYSFSSFDSNAYDAALNVHSNSSWSGTDISDTDSYSSNGSEGEYLRKRPHTLNRGKAIKKEHSNKNDTHEWVKDQKEQEPGSSSSTNNNPISGLSTVQGLVGEGSMSSEGRRDIKYRPRVDIDLKSIHRKVSNDHKVYGEVDTDSD